MQLSLKVISGNRCHFVLLDKDESCPTADLSNMGRPNGPAYSTGEQLNTPLVRAIESNASIGEVKRLVCRVVADLIVGAPFEGSGAVYVFRGSPAGLHVEYSQRIAATDLSRRSVEPLTAFGYSLSAGADVDDNGYPDVVVGAFQSDAVVVLRSRPVVNVMTTLRAYPKVIDPTLTQCRRDGLPYNCFKLQACLRFTVNPADR